LNIEIKKIPLNELEHFAQSEVYQHFTIAPISELRVKSYINNPHSQPNDIVLYLGLINNQLVAFRSLFAGIIQNEQEKQRFAWCSGNWVHPDFRRKGFSELLLNEAFNDWQGRLMFTNYAPNSEKLYLKSGRFHAIHQFHGFRGYLFPKTRKLVQFANKNNFTKYLFSIADFAISFVSLVKLRFYSEKKNPDMMFESFQNPDEDCYKIAQSISTKYIFNRNHNELKWIFDFSWISQDESFRSNNYPFSSYSNSFFYQTVKVFDQNNFIGFFIFSVREGHLKTLHFCLPAGYEKEVAGYLKRFCVTHKIEILTVYNYELAKQLFKRKFPFLHAKKFGQKIYSSFEIMNIENYLFQDGDGDVIFT
jgi:GNAT superfamily N-acetyltransferase